MYIDDKGIVLRCVKYNDKAFIAHVFTASRGHVSFIVTSSRGKRSNTAARLFQPMAFLSFQWNMKSSSALQRMKEVRLLFVQQSIPFDPTKRSVAMLLAEFIAHTLRDESANPNLYLYIEHSMQWLDMAESGYANFHLTFLLKLTRFLGIAPNTETYCNGHYFDLTKGYFTSSGMPSEIIMSEHDAQLLFLLSEATYETMNEISMNRQERARIVRYLSTYYTIHIPKFPELQSLEILQQLL